MNKVLLDRLPFQADQRFQTWLFILSLIKYILVNKESDLGFIIHSFLFIFLSHFTLPMQIKTSNVFMQDPSIQWGIYVKR